MVAPDPYLVRVHRPQAQQPTPPFNAPAARRLRAALGMGPEHVAYGLRASYGLPYVTPDLVTAWERGFTAPSSPELTALAGVLWCSAGELIGAPRTLREHRIARDLAPEDVAHAVGIELLAYQRMEEADSWRGNERQSTALAEVLELSLPDFITLTGRDGRLADLLRSAVTTRWQAYVRPVAKVVPLDRNLLENVLEEMHTDYQGQMVATLNWGGVSAATGSGESGRDFLDRVLDHFWSAVQRNTY
ncbi:XRE family transcriptional regulator [Streptomyces rhizosphaerihabitans]|uniref:XRE family transcriptional regulator n=1 Tax=Streptomyces rhizosphaerihabitans TaxID=1266770 RepID=UPI0021BF9A1C|nr:XRE family transcriptional regulator [Streptomyces rhizosphaerihabitans]MCT9008877.1 XRE family transcriptional regulator [Streptomyces rhizosphaerihabitans]